MSEYSSKLKSEDMDYLFEGILSLQTKEECYRFFEDICTINEIKAFEQRLQVAKMI
jgi:TrpR-related protein YerC/YecD